MCPGTTLECALLGILDYATHVTKILWLFKVGKVFMVGQDLEGMSSVD